MEQDYKNHPLYRKHDLDSAMSSLWNFYKSNFIQFFLISFVMSLVIQYASTMINMKELQELALSGDTPAMFEKMKEMVVPAVIVSLIGLLFAVILQHFVIYKPLGNPGILTSILSSLKYYFPFLVIIILMAFFGSFALFLGLLLLFIGAFFAGLYLFTLYIFVLPILMVEGPNISNAIGRTFSLVHRNFWNNLGWAAVFLIILIVLTVILTALLILPLSGEAIMSAFSGGENTDLVDKTTSPLVMVLSAAINALTLPLMPIFGCIMYFSARAREDESLKVPEEEYRPKIEDLYSRPRDETRDDPDR
jgi:preprotein translocase subunit SecG